MSELAIVNMNLPARVWLPLYDFVHYVVRIPYRSAAVLNSKEKAPYIVYIEVIECENVFTTPLTAKLLDNNLQTVKSQENLLLNNNNNKEPTAESSDANSQVNFNIQESASQPQLQQQNDDSSSPHIKIVTEKDNSQSTANNGGKYIPATNSFFDPNNCDRWSISSDVGPINGYSNGHFKVGNLTKFRYKKFRC